MSTGADVGVGDALAVYDAVGGGGHGGCGLQVDGREVHAGDEGGDGSAGEDADDGRDAAESSSGRRTTGRYMYQNLLNNCCFYGAVRLSGAGRARLY